jgi:hypothetical protein
VGGGEGGGGVKGNSAVETPYLGRGKKKERIGRSVREKELTMDKEGLGLSLSEAIDRDACGSAFRGRAALCARRYLL